MRRSCSSPKADGIFGVTGGQGLDRKSLKLTDKDKACHSMTGLVSYETDGSRTRNLRIDSPVL